MTIKKWLFAMLIPVSLFADVLQENGIFPNVKLKDQFEKEVVINAQTKQIIIAFTKAQGETMKVFLEANPHYLSDNNALYMMDATEVPSVIMSMFMMPKFKKYGYSVGLVEDKQTAQTLPKQNDKLTVLSLDNLRITQIDFKEAL
ncbi:hypothetical protein [Sulfurospirillum sp. hDNRA2]|uniref:hypothetical protein n=1 Tax=Sulfurospirillum sp. hDNRA2 TaxID=3237298 RepID=UPI0020B79A27|nr:hypothetical protein [Sulfurospirillum sp. DNRA8]MCP3652930.1 hypothetical protein [Sulfurospirillum sp. DNRA8]MCR1811782.1 hypothetical protein [Sulfurospirillum sp. DNRA8]